MPDKPLTWTDIENNLRNSQNGVETDQEKLEYFKKQILDHLDKLQEKEDKKIIPFPQKEAKNGS